MSKAIKITDEQLIQIIKDAFYVGFKKCKYDDANCFTRWREEAPKLIQEIKLKIQL